MGLLIDPDGSAVPDDDGAGPLGGDAQFGELLVDGKVVERRRAVPETVLPGRLEAGARLRIEERGEARGEIPGGVGTSGLFEGARDGTPEGVDRLVTFAASVVGQLVGENIGLVPGATGLEIVVALDHLLADEVGQFIEVVAYGGSGLLQEAVDGRRADRDDLAARVDELLAVSAQRVEEVLMGAIGPQALDRLGIGIEGDPDSAEMGREVRLGQIATDGATQQGNQLRQRHRMVRERGRLHPLPGSCPKRQKLGQHEHSEQQRPDPQTAWLPCHYRTPSSFSRRWWTRLPGIFAEQVRAVDPCAVGSFVLLPQREVSLFLIVAVFSTAGFLSARTGRVPRSSKRNRPATCRSHSI